MTELQMLEATPARAMTAEEEALARDFYAAIQSATNESPRSVQASAHRIGVSDLGHCSERVRRHIAGEQEPAVDHLPAAIGTALGDYVEAAVVAKFPNLIRQAEVELTLYGDGGTYVLSGHPDLIDPAGWVIDVKTSDGLDLIRRKGPSQQQVFQRNLYAKAAHQMGLFDDGVALEQVRVCNIWFDRSAREREAYVQSDLYDERVIEAATAWLDDTVYAFVHGEHARKEPPIAMCLRSCGFYLDCRAGDGTVGGLIEDHEQLAAIEMFMEGAELERRGKRLKDQSKQALKGVEGSTGAFTVRWSKVNGGFVAYERPGYERLDIRPVR
jgi:hypothetical protein